MAQVMQHKLRILVLKHLAERPRAGYGLIKDIHEHTGWKPSYGSIYPLLEQLKKEGLVTVEETPKKKIYHLTSEGAQAAQGLKLDSKEAMATLEQLHRLAMHLCGIKGGGLPISDMLRSIASPDPEMKRIMKASYDLKLEFARLMKEGTYKRNVDSICAMMERMTEELKRL